MIVNPLPPPRQRKNMVTDLLPAPKIQKVMRFQIVGPCVNLSRFDISHGLSQSCLTRGQLKNIAIIIGCNCHGVDFDMISQLSDHIFKRSQDSGYDLYKGHKCETYDDLVEFFKKLKKNIPEYEIKTVRRKIPPQSAPKIVDYYTDKDTNRVMPIYLSDTKCIHYREYSGLKMCLSVHREELGESKLSYDSEGKIKFELSPLVLSGKVDATMCIGNNNCGCSETKELDRFGNKWPTTKYEAFKNLFSFFREVIFIFVFYFVCLLLLNLIF